MLFTKTESQEKEIRGWGNLILATEIRDVSGATVVWCKTDLRKLGDQAQMKTWWGAGALLENHMEMADVPE